MIGTVDQQHIKAQEVSGGVRRGGRRYAGSRALIRARARAAVEVSGGVRRRYVARLNMLRALM